MNLVVELGDSVLANYRTFATRSPCYMATCLPKSNMPSRPSDSLDFNTFIYGKHTLQNLCYVVLVVCALPKYT